MVYPKPSLLLLVLATSFSISYGQDSFSVTPNSTTIRDFNSGEPDILIDDDVSGNHSMVQIYGEWMYTLGRKGNSTFYTLEQRLLAQNATMNPIQVHSVIKVDGWIPRGFTLCIPFYGNLALISQLDNSIPNLNDNGTLWQIIAINKITGEIGILYMTPLADNSGMGVGVYVATKIKYPPYQDLKIYSVAKFPSSFVSFYEIYVAGTYFDLDLNVNQTFVMRFNERTNMTEWLKYQPTRFAARVTGIHVLPFIDMVYVIGEVDNNTYFGSVANTRSNIFNKNRCVFIRGHQIFGGALSWTQNFGHYKGGNYYIGHSNYEGYFALSYSTATSSYSVDPDTLTATNMENNTDTENFRVREVAVVLIRAERGEILWTSTIAGPNHTSGYGVFINTHGVQVLVKATGAIYPHYTFGKRWSLFNSTKPNYGVMWYNWEGVPLTFMGFIESSTVGTRQFARGYGFIRGTDLLPRFVFLYADDIPTGKGLYFTEPNMDAPMIETTTLGCGLYCDECFALNPSLCIKCVHYPQPAVDVIAFFRNRCYASFNTTIPDPANPSATIDVFHSPCETINVPDWDGTSVPIAGRVIRGLDLNRNLSYCAECHHACRSCSVYSRSTTYGCSCPGPNFVTRTPGEPPDYYCVCQAGKRENLWTCGSQCTWNYTAWSNVNTTCMLGCPKNQIFSLIESNATQFLDGESSTYGPSTTYTFGTRFVQAMTGLVLPAPPNFGSTPGALTVSMWIYPMGTTPYPNTRLTFANLFGIFSMFRDKHPSLATTFSFGISIRLTNVFFTPTAGVPIDCPTLTWCHFAMSINKLGASNFTSTILLYTSNTGTFNTETTSNLVADITTYRPLMIIGGDVTSDGFQAIPNTSFDGVVSDFVIQNYYHTSNWLLKNINRLYANASKNNEFLVGYWRLNTSDACTNATACNFTWTDSSKYNLNVTLTVPAASYPRPQVLVSNPRSLVLWNDILTCYAYPHGTNPAAFTPHSDWFEKTPYPWSISTPPPGVFTQDDTLVISRYGCGVGGAEADIMTYSPGSLKFVYPSNVKRYNKDVGPGMYDFCFYKKNLDLYFVAATVKVSETPIYVTPSETAVHSLDYDATIVFRILGGNINLYDSLVLSQDCYDYGNSLFYAPGQQVFRTNASGDFFSSFQLSNTAVISGIYYICYVPAYAVQYNPKQAAFIGSFSITFQAAPKQSGNVIPTYIRQCVITDLLGDLQVTGAATFFHGDKLHFSNSAGTFRSFGSITFMYGAWPYVFPGVATGVKQGGAINGLHEQYFIFYEPNAGKTVIRNGTLAQYESVKMNNGSNSYVLVAPNEASVDVTSWYPAYINYGIKNNEDFYIIADRKMVPTVGTVAIKLQDYTTTYPVNLMTIVPSSDNAVLFSNTMATGLEPSNVTGDTNGSISISRRISQYNPGAFYRYTMTNGAFQAAVGNQKLFDRSICGIANFGTWFQVLDYDIPNNLSRIYYTTTYLNISGSFFQEVNVSVSNNSNASPYLFVTTAFKARLYIFYSDDKYCNYNPENITNLTRLVRGAITSYSNNYAYIPNLDLRGCKTGTLMANVSIRRQSGSGVSAIIKDTYRDQIILGVLGCDTSCRGCNGNGPAMCTICADGYFYWNGACQAACPPEGRYATEVWVYNNDSMALESMHQCVADCPDDKWPDNDTSTCQPCNMVCLTCSGPSNTECLSCLDSYLLIENVCTTYTTCPPGYEREGSACIGTNSSTPEGFSIEILPTQYTSVGGLYPPDRDIVLTAKIIDPTSNLSSVIWRNFEITPFLNETIFKSSYEGTSTVMIDIELLNKYSNNAPFTIIVIATNSRSTVSAKTSIYINKPPQPGKFIFSPIEGFPLSTNFSIDISGWSDDIGTSMPDYPLTFSVQFQLPVDVENTFLLKSPISIWSYKSQPPSALVIHNVLFPFINMEEDTNITVLLTVTDIYNSSTTLSQPLHLLRNNSLFGSNTHPLLSFQDIISYTPSVFNTLDDVLLYVITMANIGFRELADPYQVCQIDSDCYGQGNCVADKSFSQCVCLSGFFGINCQWTINFIQNAQKRTEASIEWTYNTFNLSSPVPDYNAIQIVSFILSSLLKASDLVSEKALETALLVAQYMATMDPSTASSIDEMTTKRLADSLSGLLDVIQTQRKLETIESADLLYGYNPPEKVVRQDDVRKITLATGRKRYIQCELMYNATIDTLQKLSRTLQPGGAPTILESKNFNAEIISQSPSSYRGALVTFVSSNYSLLLSLPSDVFSRLDVSHSSQIVVVIIQWKGNPFIYMPSTSTMVETPIVTVHFSDIEGNPLALSNLQTPFELVIPFTPGVNTKRERDFVRCEFWNRKGAMSVDFRHGDITSEPTTELPSAEEITVLIAREQPNLHVFDIESIEWLHSSNDYESTEDEANGLVDPLWKEKMIRVNISVPKFDEEGCGAVAVTEKDVLCRCNHFSDFAGVYQDYPAKFINLSIGSQITTKTPVGHYAIYSPLNHMTEYLGYYVMLVITPLYFATFFCLSLFEAQWNRLKVEELTKNRELLSCVDEINKNLEQIRIEAEEQMLQEQANQQQDNEFLDQLPPPTAFDLAFDGFEPPPMIPDDPIEEDKPKTKRKERILRQEASEGPKYHQPQGNEQDDPIPLDLNPGIHLSTTNVPISSLIMSQSLKKTADQRRSTNMAATANNFGRISQSRYSRGGNDYEDDFYPDSGRDTRPPLATVGAFYPKIGRPDLEELKAKRDRRGLFDDEDSYSYQGGGDAREVRRSKVGAKGNRAAKENKQQLTGIDEDEETVPLGEEEKIGGNQDAEEVEQLQNKDTTENPKEEAAPKPDVEEMLALDDDGDKNFIRKRRKKPAGPKVGLEQARPTSVAGPKVNSFFAGSPEEQEINQSNNQKEEDKPLPEQDEPRVVKEKLEQKDQHQETQKDNIPEPPRQNNEPQLQDYIENVPEINPVEEPTSPEITKERLPQTPLLGQENTLEEGYSVSPPVTKTNTYVASDIGVTEPRQKIIPRGGGKKHKSQAPQQVNSSLSKLPAIKTALGFAKELKVLAMSGGKLNMAQTTPEGFKLLKSTETLNKSMNKTMDALNTSENPAMEDHEKGMLEDNETPFAKKGTTGNETDDMLEKSGSRGKAEGRINLKEALEHEWFAQRHDDQETHNIEIYDEQAEKEKMLEDLQQKISEVDEMKKRHQYRSSFLYLLLRGHSITNLYEVNSLTLSRTARVSLLFMTLYAHFFFSAVLLLIGKDPMRTAIQNPKFRGSDDIPATFLYAFLSCLLTTPVMYLYYWVFQTNDIRIRRATAPESLRKAIGLAKKEIKIRNIAGHALIWTSIGLVFWFSLWFTALYGWSLSYTWFWTAITAFFLYDMILLELLGAYISSQLHNPKTRILALLERIKEIKLPKDEE